MTTHVWWYLSRASGIVTWIMLTASVMWGVFLSTNLLQSWKRPAWLLDLHKWLGALTMGFLTLHVAALLLNTYAPFNVTDVLLPFHSSYQVSAGAPGGRFAVAGGVIAMWALIVVEVTSLLMKRIPRKTWHSIHLVSYLTFWLGTIHGMLVGTDATHLLYGITAGASIGMVAFASIFRYLTRKRVRRSQLDSTSAARNTHLERSFG